jgi:membrane-associated phospholipid phosphatase
MKYWRYFFLGFSVLMAITVLLGHLHYSIDVFAAFFIAHGVFVVAKKIFKQEHALMHV